MENDINSEELSKKIINILYLSGEEIAIKKISEILLTKEEDVTNLIKDISLKLESIGLSLLQNNNNLCITTNVEYSDILKSFTKYEVDGELTPAALQTLTIISYLDNPSVADISFIRGINSSLTVRTLMTKGLIEKINTDKYTISVEALKYLGVSKREDLIDYTKLNQELKAKLNMSLNG